MQLAARVVNYLARIADDVVAIAGMDAARVLWRPRRLVDQWFFGIALASRWTHEWYPDWHEIGCPGLHGQPCSRYCSVEVRRRRQEMSGSGRFYRRVHLGIWLAGVRWWHFWLHLGLRSYTVFDAIERFLAPDLFADES